MRQEMPISTPPLSGAEDRLSTVARPTASARLKESDDGAGLETALRYRLVSPWTNRLAIVIAARPDEEKAQDLPALHKVQQTLAAGWGGVRMVADFIRMDAFMATRARSSPGDTHFADVADIAFSATEASHQAPDLELLEPYSRLLDLMENDPTRLDVTRAFDLLREAGFAPEFDDLLRRAADQGLNVDVIAATVLARPLGGPLGEYLSSRTQGAVGSLRDYAVRTTDALRELGRHGKALARVTRDTGGVLTLDDKRSVCGSPCTPGKPHRRPSRTEDGVTRA
jgi:hypothetical protein